MRAGRRDVNGGGASEGGYPYRRAEFLLEGLEANAQQKYLSVSPGDVLELMLHGDGFELERVERREFVWSAFGEFNSTDEELHYLCQRLNFAGAAALGVAGTIFYVKTIRRTRQSALNDLKKAVGDASNLLEVATC